MVNLPWHSYASTDVYHGSGFANSDSSSHSFAGHTTFDLTFAKDSGERFSVLLTGIHVANRRVLLDNSVTFIGTHYLNPREIFAQVRYRFHYGRTELGLTHRARKQTRSEHPEKSKGRQVSLAMQRPFL